MLTVVYEYVRTESSGTCISVVFNHNSAIQLTSFPRLFVGGPKRLWYYLLYIAIVGAILVRQLSGPQPPIAAHKTFPVFL